MYIYHECINALSAHIMHINLNTIFFIYYIYIHVQHSPTIAVYLKYYLKWKKK